MSLFIYFFSKFIFALRVIIIIEKNKDEEGDQQTKKVRLNQANQFKTQIRILRIA